MNRISDRVPTECGHSFLTIAYGDKAAGAILAPAAQQNGGTPLIIDEFVIRKRLRRLHLMVPGDYESPLQARRRLIKKSTCYLCKKESFSTV